jgi:hypothetical protein
VLVALAARLPPLVLVRDATRRGPPRTPCVVART